MLTCPRISILLNMSFLKIMKSSDNIGCKCHKIIHIMEY
jgi:hypothetical protein